MSTVILACSTLEEYIKAAQIKMNTDYPVICLDKRYHVEPKDMQKHIKETMATIPPDVDTVLVAMGFCGGSWADLSFDKRIIIPRVDDCITILLHTDDTWYANKKETGHMYAISEESSGFSPTIIYEEMLKEHEKWEADLLFDMWFHNYSYFDIVDTGLYDCYQEEYVEKMQQEADFIHCQLDFVEGSNYLLEKLVSGKWDQQFLIIEPGRKITHGDFF